MATNQPFSAPSSAMPITSHAVSEGHGFSHANNSRAEGASALPKAGVKAQPERLICHLPATQIPSPPKKSCQHPPLTAINISPQQLPPSQQLTIYPPPENSWRVSYGHPATI